ncbi:hypothetical protein OQJ19_00790 [Fluoribacter gormanii]|uniref:Uncharacterized protein n=1 Tax=Fluoribacter gormanii TaxID=464 RepID=A0A377GI15_9GAMM|nr:hypothetical protein [Fluoribacter gormanii]KTD03399.1 hypothetical protein Lgor_1384 [Fluoribacter gormanii]MCW8469196.1 hypothetical protein [Fluoribacter gormanii]SIQ50515.1 hypothetical protein SAMN05421777_101181 [Fluoribacter gormanii]STO24426.1 Uncharacterised protein [Fluoribacter gormanii]
MQSKNEELTSKVTAASLYAARAAINISCAAKHIFFPTPERANVPFVDRVKVEFDQRAYQVAEDLAWITIAK